MEPCYYYNIKISRWWIFNRCESASWCRLEATGDVFNHTCDDVTGSYLEVEYTCRENVDDIGEKLDKMTVLGIALLLLLWHTRWAKNVASHTGWAEKLHPRLNTSSYFDSWPTSKWESRQSHINRLIYSERYFTAMLPDFLGIKIRLNIWVKSVSFYPERLRCCSYWSQRERLAVFGAPCICDDERA